MKPRVVTFKNALGSGTYTLTRLYSDLSDLPAYFEPAYTPREMLARGVFGGRYLNSCIGEYLFEWFDGVKLSDDKPRAELNYFGVLSGLPLKSWQVKGWIVGDDVRGWFEWYCRLYMGRRCDDDERQMKRWLRIGDRHKPTSDKKRQARLQWSHEVE